MFWDKVSTPSSSSIHRQAQTLVTESYTCWVRTQGHPGPSSWIRLYTHWERWLKHPEMFILGKMQECHSSRQAQNQSWHCLGHNLHLNLEEFWTKMCKYPVFGSGAYIYIRKHFVSNKSMYSVALKEQRRRHFECPVCEPVIWYSKGVHVSLSRE